MGGCRYGGGALCKADTKQSGCNWACWRALFAMRFLILDTDFGCLDTRRSPAARDTQSVHVSVSGQPALFRHAYYPVNTVKIKKKRSLKPFTIWNISV